MIASARVPPREAPRTGVPSAAVIALVAVISIALYVLVYTVFARPGKFPVDSDGQGYYAYLPSYLLNHDVSFRTVLRQNILPMYGNGLPPHQFGFTLQSTGNYLDKYGVGVAVLLLPFFLVGHVLALIAGQHANGYSTVEMFTSGGGAIVYTLLGLVLLRALLRRWFSDGAVAVTLIAVTLGSGVLVYLSWLPTISHDFSFFAVSAMLLCTARWLDAPASWLRAVLLGLAIGLVLLIRVSDVVIVGVVPLFAVGSLRQVRQRVRLLSMRWRQALAVVLTAAVAFLPQVGAWYASSGHLVPHLYQDEPFYFTSPALVQTLVWFEPHGLLPYYPVVALSLIGIAVAWFRRREMALPLTVVLLVFWYLVSAWWDWSYSSAFGDRAFIDVMPLLAIPLAYVLDLGRSVIARAGTRAVAIVLVLVTCVFTIAYIQRRLPQDGIPPSGYVDILLHPHRLLAGPSRPFAQATSDASRDTAQA